MQSRFKRWEDARLFLAVAREGSTLAASRALGITQTTIARRMDALEHALGLTLFERDTRGFRLTEDGAALIEPAECLENAALELEGAAADRRKARNRPIRFTAWDDVLTLEIAAVFAEFSELHPEVSFEFLASERRLDLSGGEADVALRLGAEVVDQTLIGRVVGATFWTYYASERYAEANGLPRTFSPDMEAHTVILLRHIPTARRNVLLCKSSAEQVMALQTGRGIGPLPIYQGDRTPGLVRCFPPPDGAELTARLLASQTAYRRPEVRSFMAFAAPRIAELLKQREPG